MKRTLLYLFTILIFLSSCKETPQDEVSESDKLEKEIINTQSTLEEINNEIIMSPESPNGYYKRAYYYKSIYDFDKAITDINRALKLTPDVPALTYLKAEILFNQAGATQNPLLYEQAEIYLLQTIQMDSTHLEAQVLEARVNMGKPNLDKAMANLDAALKADKYYAPAYFWKGMVFEIINEQEKAKSSYQTAIEIDAQYYDALHHLANIYAKELDPKAKTFYDAALNIEPMSFEVLRNKGLYLLSIEDYEGALNSFQSILSFDAICEECYYNMGNVYIAAFRDDMPQYSKDTTTAQAIVYFEKAVEINKQYEDAFYNLGLLHEFKGDKKLAVENYKKVLDINPDHELTLDALRNY